MSAQPAFRARLTRTFELAGRGTILCVDILEGSVRTGDKLIVSIDGGETRTVVVRGVDFVDFDVGSPAARAEVALTITELRPSELVLDQESRSFRPAASRRRSLQPCPFFDRPSRPATQSRCSAVSAAGIASIRVEASLRYDAGMSNEHGYAVDLVWEGNTGRGTAEYTAYSRRFRARVAGKPALVGSADATFRGDPALPNPEDLLVVSLSSCHMLSYLALAARARLRVLAYRDAATGRMRTAGGGGRFEEVVLRPHVTIARDGNVELARSLHEPAHEACFIASSCNFPIRVEPTIVVADEVAPVVRPRRDLAVRISHRPGALADLTEALGRAGASIEGGGAFAIDGAGHAHFLIEDAAAETAIAAVHALGLDVVAVRDTVVARLDQGTPGQLGKLTRALADAGVSIEVLYSDHDHQLVLVVDDADAAQRAIAAWRPR